MIKNPFTKAKILKRWLSYKNLYMSVSSQFSVLFKGVSIKHCQGQINFPQDPLSLSFLVTWILLIAI